MPDETYVARFGWSPKDLILLPTCIVFIVGGALMAVDGQPVVGVLLCGFGALYIVALVAAWLSRRVALAVTAEGITLGLMPPWPASRSAFVPWSDIEAVVLWRQGLWWRSSRYIGVVRRADAPPLPGSARSSTLRRMNMEVVPADLSEDLVTDSRQISFWRLDKDRLTTADNHFRPNVPVVDRT